VNAVVTFSVNEMLCGLPVDMVREVLPMVALRPLPRQTPPLVGLLTLRGELVPVVALRAWLGWAERRPTVLTRILAVDGAGEGTERIALVVDEVHDVVSTEGWRPGPVPPERLGGPAGYFSQLLQREGVTIALLDLTRLVALSQATTAAPAAR
jgi:purine-binding chemotaxis protein CheW